MAGRRGSGPPGDALAGIAIWVVLFALATGPLADRVGLLEGLWLVGPLVIVPLGLSLMRPPEGAVADLLLVRRANLPAAILVVASVLAEPGASSAWLAAPWVVVGVAATWAAVRWVAASPSWRAKVVVPAAALVALSIASLTLLAWRGQLRPGGQTDLAMALATVHLVFAGFGAAVVADRTRAAAARRRSRSVAGAAGIGLVVSIPVLAAGFVTRSAGIDLIATLVYAVAVTVVAVVMLIGATRRDRAASSTALLVVAGGSVLFALALAFGFAYGRWTGSTTLTLARMLELHGTVSALGFVAGGLLGWSFTDVPDDASDDASDAGVEGSPDPALEA
jgi:YndJ-like protein